MSQGPSEPCNHYWVANDGRGGLPEFQHDKMKVGCRTCGTRTTLTMKEWAAQGTHPLQHMDRAFPHKYVHGSKG